MPRSSGGTYALPAGNPVTTGTVITSTWANNTLADLATAITDSLSRAGDGGMLAPLKLPDGTSSAPALAFTNETNTGLYRAGSNDFRIQVNATHVVTFAPSLVTIPVGLTVAQDTSNGNAVTATGNGTGAALAATGGSSGGAGVSATGGASSGRGVNATGGATSGVGVYGTGGSPNGEGVHGAGTGTGAGVNGAGGATSGIGVYGSGGAPNGGGVQGQGTGTGAGVSGTGGASDGVGGVFVGGATNGTGITGTGTGDGAGGKFFNTSSATASSAVEGWSNSANAAGGFFSNASTGPAVHVNNGHIKMTGSNPLSTTGYVNHLTPKNVPKAWGCITAAAGVIDGFNIASIVDIGDSVRVTFASAMANANYAVVATSIGVVGMATANVIDASTVDFTIWLHNGTVQSWGAVGGLGVMFVVFASQ